MANPNKNARERKSYAFPKEHVAITATGSVKLFTARKRTRIDRVEYLNVTGLAMDAANYFLAQLKNGATVVAAIANTNSAGGAAIPANTSVLATFPTAAGKILEAGAVLDVTFTETGTATLPAGSVVIWFTELN